MGRKERVTLRVFRLNAASVSKPVRKTVKNRQQQEFTLTEEVLGKAAEWVRSPEGQKILKKIIQREEAAERRRADAAREAWRKMQHVQFDF